ncbi:uncharacterized protein [Venturia canescens]|uniref:uncharacterized protein n=1 Tax=Venturia canescens TaxID=32260 RepID=UPI001C9BD413|nr:uncharacterized protein LOC122410130 [Venturia canescens]
MLNKKHETKTKMGASLRQNDAEFEELSSTEQLFNWITKVRTKKIKYLRSRRRNIRVEAVLGYALLEAEQELRRKQVARINRWQQLKKQMATNNNNNTCNNNNISSKGVEMDCQESVIGDSKKVWSSELYPELSSLDNFISKLSSIKAPVKR